MATFEVLWRMCVIIQVWIYYIEILNRDNGTWNTYTNMFILSHNINPNWIEWIVSYKLIYSVLFHLKFRYLNKFHVILKWECESLKKYYLINFIITFKYHGWAIILYSIIICRCCCCCYEWKDFVLMKWHHRVASVEMSSTAKWKRKKIHDAIISSNERENKFGLCRFQGFLSTRKRIKVILQRKAIYNTVLFIIMWRRKNKTYVNMKFWLKTVVTRWNILFYCFGLVNWVIDKQRTSRQLIIFLFLFFYFVWRLKWISFKNHTPKCLLNNCLTTYLLNLHTRNEAIEFISLQKMERCFF